MKKERKKKTIKKEELQNITKGEFDSLMRTILKSPPIEKRKEGRDYAVTRKKSNAD